MTFECLQLASLIIHKHPDPVIPILKYKKGSSTDGEELHDLTLQVFSS